MEPTPDAQAAWNENAALVNQTSLRRAYDDYLVRIEKDGSRILFPYAGGVADYTKRCAEVVAADYEGFQFK